jgi:hypothetical protein
MLVLYDSSWPDIEMCVSSLPDLLLIWSLGLTLSVDSPVPRLPFLNANSDNIFGWEGSSKFLEASLTAKIHSSAAVAPANITVDSASMLGFGLEHIAGDSKTLDYPEQQILKEISRQTTSTGSASSDQTASHSSVVTSFSLESESSSSQARSDQMTSVSVEVISPDSTIITHTSDWSRHRNSAKNQQN